MYYNQTMSEQHGFIVRRRPRSYQVTDSQALLKEANEACGIQKGMKRSDLVKAMTECIPKFYRERREQNGQSD